MKPLPLPITLARPHKSRKARLKPVPALFMLFACFAVAWLATWLAMDLISLLKPEI